MSKPLLNILYEDRHLVAINKPARIGIGADKSQDETQLELVRQWHQSRQDEGKKGYCVPIHFLDRPVSGVVLFALSSKAAARLNDQFRTRHVTKIYYALVEGVPAQTEGVLKQWLKKDRRANRSELGAADAKDTKFCKLAYKLIAVNTKYSLLEIKPETGRSHQIRVQLASLGLPIAGDVKYGAAPLWEGKIALHAGVIGVTHPVGKNAMAIAAPLPPEWLKLWPDLKGIVCLNNRRQ